MKATVIVNVGHKKEAAGSRIVYAAKDDTGQMHLLIKQKTVATQTIPDWYYLPKSVMKSLLTDGSGSSFWGAESIEKYSDLTTGVAFAPSPVSTTFVGQFKTITADVLNGYSLPEFLNTTTPQAFGTLYADGITEAYYPSGGVSSTTVPTVTTAGGNDSKVYYLTGAKTPETWAEKLAANPWGIGIGSGLATAGVIAGVKYFLKNR